MWWYKRSSFCVIFLLSLFWATIPNTCHRVNIFKLSLSLFPLSADLRTFSSLLPNNMLREAHIFFACCLCHVTDLISHQLSKCYIPWILIRLLKSLRQLYIIIGNTNYFFTLSMLVIIFWLLTKICYFSWQRNIFSLYRNLVLLIFLVEFNLSLIASILYCYLCCYRLFS